VWLLASAPQTGHVRHDLTARPVRFWTVPRFQTIHCVRSSLQPATNHPYPSRSTRYSRSPHGIGCCASSATSGRPGRSDGSAEADSDTRQNASADAPPEPQDLVEPQEFVARIRPSFSIFNRLRVESGLLFLSAARSRGVDITSFDRQPFTTP
jgi:hypothetical protein